MEESYLMSEEDTDVSSSCQFTPLPSASDSEIGKVVELKRFIQDLKKLCAGSSQEEAGMSL